MVGNDKPLRVMVGVTAAEMVHTSFLHAFSGAIVHLAGYAQVSTCFVVNKEISMARQIIVEKAVREKHDVLVFVDDMVILHPHALAALAISKHPVTAFNYLKSMTNGALIFSARKGVTPVVTSEEQTGCEEVDEAGLMLFQLTLGSQFRDWFGPQGKPLFQAIGTTPEKHFAAMMKRVGLPLHVDHMVSNTCGILGQYMIFSKDFAKEA